MAPSELPQEHLGEEKAKAELTNDKSEVDKSSAIKSPDRIPAEVASNSSSPNIQG
jgi:hypothetical protein